MVGLCGSAGPLGPLSEIFSQLTLDTGMAFVVVQHMSASRVSLLPAILSRATSNDRRGAAISVILSGMDNDGIMGTAAIKKVGGITMAQRVDTASQPDLPHNVIADGLVDFIESRQGIAQLLLQFSRT